MNMDRNFINFLSKFVLSIGKNEFSTEKKNLKEYELVLYFLDVLCKKYLINELFIMVKKEEDNNYPNSENKKKEQDLFEEVKKQNSFNSYFASQEKTRKKSSPIGFYHSFLEYYIENFKHIKLKDFIICLKDELFKQDLNNNQLVPEDFFKVMKIECMDIIQFSYFNYNIYVQLVFLEKKSDIYLKNQNIIYEILSILSYFLILSRKRLDQQSSFENFQKDIDELRSFSSILSHELKRPIGNIRTYLDLLLTETKIKNQKKIDVKELKVFENKLEYLNSLVNSTLNYFRIHWIENTPIEEVNMNNLVLEVINSLTPPKDIEIRIENALPKIWIHRIPMMQIFENLISNAIKYSITEKGKAFVHIGGRILSQANKVEFWVKDNGLGIPYEEQKLIFNLFYRVNTKEKNSTGIGLALVKKILDMYSGSIKVKSQIGKGSKFYFEIPL